MKLSTTVIAALLATLAYHPAAAQEAPAEFGAERRPGHVLVGAGPSWAHIRDDSSVDPAVMLGLDLPLGNHVRLGLFGDITFGNNRFGRSYRVFTGPEIKILPVATGRLRPYLTGSLALSLLDNTGFGLGGGVGTFILTHSVPFYVDLRGYHIQDMESSPYDQFALRAGIVF